MQVHKDKAKLILSNIETSTVFLLHRKIIRILGSITAIGSPKMSSFQKHADVKKSAYLASDEIFMTASLTLKTLAQKNN